MKNRIGSQRIVSIGTVAVQDANPSELANALCQLGHPCGAVLLPSYYQFLANTELAVNALMARGVTEVPKAPQPQPPPDDDAEIVGDNGDEPPEGDE